MRGVQAPLISEKEHTEMADSADQGEDLKGDRGGDTGNTKQKGKGPTAEKGEPAPRRDG